MEAENLAIPFAIRSSGRVTPSTDMRDNAFLYGQGVCASPRGRSYLIAQNDTQSAAIIDHSWGQWPHQADMEC